MSDLGEPFLAHRPVLIALAYRMLGEVARAEDVVQEAWIRWQRRQVDVESPKAFLLTTVARLCLDELGSARARREETRADRLPEPVDLAESDMGRVEMVDQISMAFLVVLQRLTPAERAVFLLHEVFEMEHKEIGERLGKSEASCRQLLKRAKTNVAEERRVFQTSPDEHRRLLAQFVAAITTGDEKALVDSLAAEVVLTVDPGPGDSRFGRLKNIRKPVAGRDRVIALIQSFLRQEPSNRLVFAERSLNGEPAIVTFLDGRAMSAMSISVADGAIRHVFLQNDPARLRHIGCPKNKSS